MSILLASALSPASGVPAVESPSQAAQITTLRAGEPIEKEIKGGEAHLYEVSLSAGQFVRVVIDQRGSDVVVTLSRPGDAKLLEVDRPNGSFGPEELVWVATRQEKYRLEVRTLEQTAAPGVYKLKIAEVRQSTAQDQKRLSAQEALSRGARLRERRNPELAQEAVKSIGDSLKLWLETEESSSAAYAAGQLAETHLELGDRQKAVEYYQQALSLHGAAKDQYGELIALKSLGNLNLNIGESRRALEFYQQSLALEKSIGNKKSEAITLNDMGRLHSRLGEMDKALDYYQRALALEREVADHVSEAVTLGNMGGVYSSNRDSRLALEHYQQALLIHRRLKNPSGEAVTLNGIGVVYLGTGQFRKALEYFEDAVSTFKELGERQFEAAALGNIGEVYANLAEYEKSLEAYQKALSIHRSLGDRYREASALNGIGTVYSFTLGPRKALEYFEQALALRKNIGDRSGEAVTLLNIGNTYWDLKEYQKSLNYTFQALDNFRSLGDRLGQAKALYHIGWVYFSTTENRKAVEYLQQALPLYRAIGHQADELTTVDTLARAWANAGDHRKALEYVQQKLTLLKAMGNQAGIAEVTGMIGILYSELGEPQNALPYLQNALQLHKEAGNRREEAVVLNGLGWFYYTQGDGKKAGEYYQESLSIWKTLRDADWQARLLYNLAELECYRGAWEEAEKLLTEALDLEESELAVELLSGAELQKKFFLKQYVRSLQLSISINAQRVPNDAGAARLALTTLLRRKGRVLDTLAEEYSALRRNASAGTVALLEQLSQQVSRQTQLKLRGPEGGSPRDYESKINELQAKIEELQLKLNDSSLAFRMQNQKVSLDAVRQSIPRDTALVEFTLWLPFERARREVNKFGKARYVAYVLFDQGDPKLVDLGDAETINLLAVKLRSLQRERLAEIGEIKKAARALDELIMRPIRQRLGSRTRLLISPENQLNLVPFAALVDERGEYLVKNYKVSYLTSGRDLLRLQLPRQTNDPPLIIANPDFENTAGWSSGRSLPTDKSRGGMFGEMKWTPLPGTEGEARAIKNLLPTANLRMGGEATEAEIKQMNAPSVVHLATHGFFLADLPREKPSLLTMLIAALNIHDGEPQGENPMLRSGLALAGANHKRSGEEDGVLTAMEMAGLNLWGTRLVVLSACQTGVGDVETGEGVYGLRRAIVLAGAEAQVMTLWKVDDSVTAKLMVEYYTNLLKKGEGRADALREVQLRMLGGEKTQHPYFWAGFIESGAWTEITGSNDSRTKTEKQ